MEFLRLDHKKKVLRTRLYGDQLFGRFELEVIHTPIFQRLYNLKQLGFADRVFPDAIHSRFNHVLGVAQMAEQMAEHLKAWLTKEDVSLKYVSRDAGTRIVTSHDLIQRIRDSRAQLRMMALLHDLTHAAFGHTLEDEVSVFYEKHDDIGRQTRFFNALVGQLVYLWATSLRLHPFDAQEIESLANLRLSSDDFKVELGMADRLHDRLISEERSVLAQRLRELEAAQTLLTNIEFAHGKGNANSGGLLGGLIAARIDPRVQAIDIDMNRDLFLVDLVGNTICADLLDYARRDADNAGLRVQYDDRFLRYLCLVSVDGDLSPTGVACIRTAVQVFRDKMRHDVLSEMSGVLKARYLINERILFHPTKCAAGAMLGSAVQLLALRDLPGWLQTLGDQEFIRTLLAIARNAERFCQQLRGAKKASRPKTREEAINAYWPTNPEMGEVVTQSILRVAGADQGNLTDEQLIQAEARANAARNVLWKLCARRFPKLAYRLRVARHSAGASDKTIAAKYKQADERYELERRIERECNLPIGAVFIHCPGRQTSLKVAEALVVGDDPGTVRKLRNVTGISAEGLQPYESEIRAIEDMYESIWQFHAFLDPTFWDKQPIVEWALERDLTFPNDKLLKDEMEDDPRGIYHLLAGRLQSEILGAMSDVISRVDGEMGDLRHQPASSVEGRLVAIIGEVLRGRGVRTDASTAQAKRELSQALFESGCREIFIKYLPAIAKGRLLEHHKAFMARMGRASAGERFDAMELLRKYDLSDLPGLETHFNRTDDPFSEAKLADIENRAKNKEA